MLMLESLSHIALVVKDPARTAALFHDLFGARVIERKDDEGHLETFVRLGGVWVVLVGASVERARTGDQIAFRSSWMPGTLMRSLEDRLGCRLLP